MKHKTKGFIAMILALCLMMSLGIGAMADNGEPDPEDATGGNPPPGGQDPSGGNNPAPQENTYTLTVNATNGSVNITCDGSSFTNGSKAEAGSTIVVTYSANKGYSYQGVTATGIDVNSDVAYAGNKMSFTMPSSDVTLTFNFFTTRSVSLGTITNGTVTPSVTQTAPYSWVSLTVTPAEGYELDKLTVTSGESEITTESLGGNQYRFAMPDADVTVTATFKQTEQPDPEPTKYTVSANTGNFTISGTGDYAEGENVSLTIIPNTGYYLHSVYIDEVYTQPGEGGNYTFTMPGHDVSVKVVAKLYSDWRDWHDIDTYSNSVDGGISVASGALEGSTVTFRVWSNFKYDYNYDYRVYVTNDRTGATVKCDYSSYYDEYSFTMPDDDVTISVYFDHVGDYTITKDVEGDGSIYVQSSADYDEPVWITVKPGSGQSLTSLRVFRENYGWYQTSDGKWHGYGKAEVDVEYSKYYDAYYFYMPADDVVVYARFTDGATVTVTSGDHGSAKVSSRYAEKGDWVYITAYPDDGYEVADVTVVDRLGKSVKVTELSSDYFLFTMPGTSVDVKVTFREADYGYFYDVSRGDWYYEAVRFVHEKGIMAGTSTHYFSPNADLSRGMLATILYRLEGSPNVSGYSSFNDVADTSYYAKAIAWAERNGIVNGVTTERFEPDTAVTREQMAAILCRYADYKGHDTSVSYDYLATFGDSGSSHVYARPALNWAVAHRIINGQGSSVLAPRATATRAEVAQVLMNYLEAYD